MDSRRFIALRGSPWVAGTVDEPVSAGGTVGGGLTFGDLEDAENLTLSLVACLARAQFKLQISINMDKSTRVYFFIRLACNSQLKASDLVKKSCKGGLSYKVVLLGILRVAGK